MSNISSDENPNILTHIIKKHKSKIIYIIKNITKVEIKDINYEQICKIEDIQFIFIKAKIILKSKEEKEIYLKLIKQEEIKETIFYYWKLIYETKNEQTYKINFENRRIITIHGEKEMYQNNVIKHNKSIKDNLIKSSKLHFVKLLKFMEKENEKSFKKWREQLEKEDREILFIGINTN